MVAVVDICNAALQNLGSRKITSLNEGSVNSQEVSFRYPLVRRAVLEIHPWNFAIKRTSLALDATPPVFGFENAFVLPTDFIRMVATEEQADVFFIGNPNFNGYVTISQSSAFQTSDVYQIEGRRLLSNDAAKNIIYVRDEEDTTKFSSTFVELLAQGLAAAIAYKVTNSKTNAEKEMVKYKDMLRDFQTTDAQQSPIRVRQVSSFIAARF